MGGSGGGARVGRGGCGMNEGLTRKVALGTKGAFSARGLSNDGADIYRVRCNAGEGVSGDGMSSSDP